MYTEILYRYRYRWANPDKDSEPGEALADLYSECPVILGVPTAGTYRYRYRSIYVFIYIYTYINMYVYTYIYIERERDR